MSNYDEVSKFYRQVKNGMTIKELANKLGISEIDVLGNIELANLYGKKLELENVDNELIIIKHQVKKTEKVIKHDIEDLIHTKLVLVSDTHLGSTRQQLHLLNKVYEEAYKREISTVLHCGDIIDGDYRKIRPEQEKYIFLNGFDEFAGYVYEYYPQVSGIETHFILGSHDETLYKNGGASLSKWIPMVRKDMIFEGQDYGIVNINGVKIALDHPGDGSSFGLSYKLQKRIENLSSGDKPKILAIGHYHKNYYSCYRNVHGFLVPALCNITNFQIKKGISNSLGAYFLDIYSNNLGNIEYISPYLMEFTSKDIWDECGKDKNKVKALKL